MYSLRMSCTRLGTGDNLAETVYLQAKAQYCKPGEIADNAAHQQTRSLLR